MKFTAVLIALTFFVSIAYAQNRCPQSDKEESSNNTTEQTNCAKSQQLPESALAEVEKLRVEMRFMTSIGFAKKAKEKKDAIMAIYQAHGVTMPEGLLEF